MERDVFVVVPTLNEATVLRDTIKPLLDFNYSIVVVDDGSTDDTWSVLSTLPVYSLRHLINLGQGAALQTGMSFALRRGAAYIVHFDADGQHRASDIEVLLEPLRNGQADVALGSRFLRREDTMEVPALRRLILRGAVIVNAIMTGVWLSDAHNGFRAFRRDAAAKINLRENRFAHASEILIQIRRRHLRYVERPTTIVYSDYSKVKGQSAWNAIKIVIDVFLRRIFR